MAAHELKTDTDQFRAIVAGAKRFEFRRDDRGFKVGDLLHLRETGTAAPDMRPGERVSYTGRSCWAEVTYVLRGPAYGVPEGFAVLSLRLMGER